MNKKFITNNLRLIFWNVRGIRSKKLEIEKMLLNLDILICVKSWLDDKVNNDKFQFKGFLVYRQDRYNTTGGGGIVFIIRKNIGFVEINNLQFPNQPLFEICGIEITNTSEPFSIIACYKPPHVSLSQTDWDNITNVFHTNQPGLLLGDFNAHNQAWNCSHNNTNGTRFYSSILKNDLFLHNPNTLTDVDSRNGNKSNIDLVLSSALLAHKISINVENDLCGSDHFPISISFNLIKYSYQKKTFKIQTKKTNWHIFTENLNENYTNFYSVEYNDLSPLLKYNLYIDTIKKAIELSTPMK